MRLHTILAGVALLGTTALGAPCHAQNTEGALQLGLSTGVFSYTTATLTAEVLGTETETDVSTTRWGIGNNVLGEIGYGLGDSLVLGGVIELDGESTTTEPESGEESESSEFSLLLAPKLDYMFSPGSKTRPFVGVAAGLVLQSEETSVETSLTGFQLMGRVGLRAFLTDGFSIDPAFAFSWMTASGEADVGTQSIDISASGFAIGLLVGFSGWLD